MRAPLLLLLVLPVLACAGPAEDASAALASAKVNFRTGQQRPALADLARAMKLASEADDPRLALEVARQGAYLARKLDAPRQADLYVTIAQEEGARVHALDRAEGRFPRAPAPVPEKPREELPFGLYANRATIAAFRERVKKDPAYLAGLTHLKAFRDDTCDSIVGTLEHPEVITEKHRFFEDDYKTIGDALAYYKFVLQLSSTLDDTFGLAVLYVNLTALSSRDHPVTRWIFALTKSAAIAEAITRIVQMHVTGPAMDLTILAFDKAVIDLIQRYDHPERQKSGLPLLGIEDEQP